MRSNDLPNSIMDNHQEPHVRKRENPFLYGIVRSHSGLNAGGPIFDLHGSASNQNPADVSKPKVNFGDLSDEVSETPTKNSSIFFLVGTKNSSITEEMYGFLYQKEPQKFGTAPSFSSACIALVSENDLDEGNDLVKESILRDYVANEGSYTIPSVVKPTIQRTYSLNKIKSDISGIPLPQSAASFYSGNLPPRVEIG